MSDVIENKRSPYMSSDSVPVTPECPTCGERNWRYIAGVSSTEKRYMFADGSSEVSEIDQETMDSLPWECLNGHVAPDDIDERLNYLEDA